MKLLRWLIAVTIIAAATHGALLYFGPSLIMGQAMTKIGDLAGVNAMAYPPRPNAANDAIVRSSPDLLYNVCVYDVSEKPLLLTAEIPPGTYWSASFYDLNTNNYRVINDAQATTGGIRVLLTKPGTPAASAPAGAETVVSPTTRGLILIRTLVSNEAAFPAIDAARRQASCRLL